MPLNLITVENFVAENKERMSDKALLRHERYRILSKLRDKLQHSLDDYIRFESELSSLVVDRITSAKTYRDLSLCHKRAVGGIEKYFLEEDTIADVHDLFRIVRDGLTIRVIELVEEDMDREGYGYPPTNFVWVGMGSEGRDEQTLMTDQDNMILYGQAEDEFGTDFFREGCYEYLRMNKVVGDTREITGKHMLDYYFKVFAEKIVERLHEVGFEKCKGGVMPSNEKWRGSSSDFHDRLVQRITYERGIFETLDIIILTDARAIYGDKNLLNSFRQDFFRMLTDNKAVMKDLYESAVLMPTALSFFGNFKTEKSGEHKDMINIKLVGWAPLILAVRMVAITIDIFDTNTLRRVRLRREKNVSKKEMVSDLIDAYLNFVMFRLHNQINNKDGNQSNMNFLYPSNLSEDEQGKLRKAMRTVESFQKFIQERLLFGQPV
ncbi:MAG: putative nucleotidyltransferase substrate binding domain-containing protein [Syntrophorhabdus sp.]